MHDGFRTISEASQNLYCSKCAQNGGIFIELECEHVYCMMCASFLYSKCRKEYVNEAAMKCSVCNAVSILPNDSVELIKTTIKNQILPSMESQSLTTENKLTVSKNNQFSHYIGAMGRKIKSEEHSFENVTPSTTKCFFSKCQSPSSRKKPQKHADKQISNFCVVHPLQPITYACFNCEFEPLCIKCVSYNKKHAGHDLKLISKAVSFLSEQLSITKLELSYKIDEAEIYHKRLQDRNILIKDRADKILTDIRQDFCSIYGKLKQKQLQIINDCRNRFSEALQRIQQQNSEIKLHIESMRIYKDKISQVRKEEDKNQFLKKFFELRSQGLEPIREFNEKNQNKFYVPSKSIYKQLSEISQKIVNLSINFKMTTLSRVGTVGPTTDLENCRSESKNKKQSTKRMKTNFVSLNSSREKKKKGTKTEEDERKYSKPNHNNNSHRNHQKQISNSKSNKMPSYITDFINKKASKLNSESGSYIHEMTSNGPHNYTKVSKLSKTISPEEIAKKKREHKAVIKQRIEVRKKTTVK